MTPRHYERLMRIVDAVMDAAPEDLEAKLRQECSGDEQLRREVLGLLACDRKESRFLEDSLLDVLSAPQADEEQDGFAGRRIGPYRIVAEIGRGGMGAVYRAVRDDEQYETEVAVKLIKRGMDTDFVLRRFRNERQILANLNHPNIARLLDGGITEDGLPYFVMEHIEGDPLSEYCDRKQLSITERLKLFRIVCKAVQYAHQNLVIHRDLKPSNILVTSDGTPKLLDFGIAKLLHADANAQATELTATELRVMTPEYASPEQVRGEIVTTASDVYSLGVLLYELLTGHRPYRFNSRRPDEVARVICEQEPSKPSDTVRDEETRRKGDKETGKQRDRGTSMPVANVAPPHRLPVSPSQLKGDLDNILLKALKKEPQRRYASVEQFSEDIRRHLDGLPVAARRDTLAYRTQKFVRRHRAGALAVALVALALVGGMAATLWQAREARAARARAERRFNDVRRLASSFMFEFYDEVDAGPVKAKELIVKRALEYLDSLSQESANDVGLQRELATAYVKIGDVQGRILTANLGDTKGALESYRKALALYEQLSPLAPADIEVRQELAMSYGRMGEVSLLLGQPDNAAGHFRKAISIYEEVLNASPEDVLVQMDYAHMHRMLGTALGLPGVASLGDTKGALEHFRKAVSIYETISPENLKVVKSRFSNLPASTEWLLHMGAVLSDLSTTLDATGDATETMDANRRSLAFYEQGLAASPQDIRTRRNVAVQYWNTAAVLLKSGTGDKTEVLALTRKSVAMFEELSANDPNDQNFRKDVAQGYRNLGRVLSTTGGDKAQAAEHYRKSLAIFDELVKKDPSSAFMRRQLAFTHLRMSMIQSDMSNLGKAVDHAQQAITIGEALIAADNKNVTASGTLADSYAQLGKCHTLLATKAGAGKQTEHWQEARDSYRKGLSIWQNMKAKGTLSAADSGKLDDAARGIAKCDAALSS